MARGREVNQMESGEEGRVDEEKGSHLVRPTVGTLGAEEGDERRERGRSEGD